MFQERSKVLFTSNIIATIYVIYLITYFGGAMGDLNTGVELGGFIATAIITPHMLMVGLGTIFSWIGFFGKKSWAALTGAILYCIGGLLFIMYIMFCIPIIILGFIGAAKQKEISAKKEKNIC